MAVLASSEVLYVLSGGGGRSARCLGCSSSLSGSDKGSDNEEGGWRSSGGKLEHSVPDQNPH